MKKISIILILITLTLGLSGCQKDIDENTISNLAKESMEKFLDFSIDSDEYCNTFVESSSIEFCKEIREETRVEYGVLTDAGGVMKMEFVSLISNTNSNATVNTKMTLTVDGISDIEESEMELVKVDGKWFIVMEKSS